MAITREKKDAIVNHLTDLLTNSKLAAFAAYEGLTVRDMQDLRRAAEAANVSVYVAKNRLFKVAVSKVDDLKEAKLDEVSGQLVYAFGDDEVTPAQVLANFSKDHPALKLAGGLSNTAEVLDEAAIKQLASLPTKDQLRAQLVGTIAAPLTSMVGVMAGNVRGIMNVLNARAESLEN